YLYQQSLHQRDLHSFPTRRSSDLVRVDVFVIVPARQAAQLPLKALSASVVLAGGAPTVAAPVAEGFDEDAQFGTIGQDGAALAQDRKSTRLNSSHQIISYAVFCLK